MSDYRFGVDDYRLNYYPHDGVYDEQEGIDWSKVERVEIEWVNFVREHTCRIEWRYDSFDTNTGYEHDGEYFCTACNSELLYLLQEYWDDYQAGDIAKPFNYCPNCGAKVVNER